MISSYYVEVRTGEDYDTETYDAGAGRLGVMLTTLFADAEAVTQLTKEHSSCKAELEIGLEQTAGGRELVAKAVVDVTAEDRVPFDKGKFTKMLKAHPESEEWPKMRVVKKQVPI